MVRTAKMAEPLLQAKRYVGMRLVLRPLHLGAKFSISTLERTSYRHHRLHFIKRLTLKPK